MTDKKDEKPFDNNDVTDVTDEKGDPGDARVFCAYCGLPGGNEVAVQRPDGRLHRDCEDPYLNEGHNLEAMPADRGRSPASSPSRVPAFRVIGPAPSDAVCVHCYGDDGDEVLRIVGPEAGSKSETLHEKCAGQWFAELRGFGNDLSDDNDDTWQGRG